MKSRSTRAFLTRCSFASAFAIASVFSFVAVAQQKPKSQQDQETEAMRRMIAAGQKQQGVDAPLDLKLSGNDVTVETLPTGEIVIMGNDTDLNILESFINMIDREIPEKEVVIHTLAKASAEQVATKLESIIPEVYPGIQELPDQSIAVQALSSSVLLIAAPEQRVDRILQIIEAIDEVEASLPDFEIMRFQIQYRKAAEVATQLEEVVKKIQTKQGAETAEEVTFDVNDADNSITIFGPASLKDQIQNIINTIDVEPAEGFSHLKLVMYPLLNVSAEDMKSVLEDMLKSASGEQDVQEAIRRLSVIKRGPDGSQTELQPLDLDKPLRVLSDKGTNSLIIATIEKNIEPLGEIVQLLDGVPIAHEMGLKIFSLKFADADALKELMEQMFDDGKKLPERAPGGDRTEAIPPDPVGEAFMHNVNIKADKRTNILIVSGRQRQLDLARTVVEELDVPMSAARFPLKLLFCGQNVDAGRVKGIVEELFTKRKETLEKTDAGELAVAREEVFIAVDSRSNALIVSANESNFDEIQSVVGELNVAIDRLVDNIRIINCENTHAADLATKIDELWERKNRLRSEDELPEDKPILVADTRSNALIIASSNEDFAEISDLIAKLEAQPLSPIAEIRLVTLENNDASQVSDMLKQLFEERAQQRLAQGQEENPADRVAVAADPATNTMLIACSRENFDEMSRIIDAIDVEPDMEGVISIFVLQNAEAQPVADKIQELFDQGLYNPTVGLGDNAIAEERKKVAIIADVRSNSIIVSASKPNLSIVETLIERMDGEISDLFAENYKLIPLTHADAVKLVDILDKLFEGQASSTSDQDIFPKPTIIADARSNTLIITGTRDAISRCGGLITQLDRPAGPPSSVFEVYALQHGSAAKLATRMQELFDKRTEGQDEAGTPIFIQADETSNSLIASAARDDHALIEGLLELLDKPSNIAKQFHIFPLQAGRAETIAETMDQLFQQQAEGASGRADAIAVQADPRSNSLVVWASASEMDNIAAIVEKLDTARPAVEMMMRVVRLKQALAEDFAESFEETLMGGQSGGSDDEEAVIVSFVQRHDDGTETVRKLLRQDITLNPDPRTNSLMVMAPAESMDMLEALIQDFDSIAPVAAEISFYQLANADAEEVKERLDEIFQTEEQGGGENLEQRIVFGGEGGGAVSISGEGGTSRQMIRFTADRRTNSIIAAGNRVDIEMAEDLIRMLDSQDIDERIQEVYRPRNIPAGAMAANLTQFVEAENQLLQDIDDQSSARRRAEKQISVVGDEDTNVLLVGTSPRYYDDVAELIRQIDRPEPQVMISVLIAEVSVDDRFELGVEFAAQDLHFSQNATTGPNGVIQGNGFDIIAGTDIGAAGAGFGGLSLTISGEDFAFLFRALDSQGQLEVLSRPTLLVQNNATGNITIGDRVPIVSGTTSAGGQSSTQIQYEEVGIILDVTPHINPDGYVNLEIAPEISQISNQALQVSEGLVATVFSQRTAETTVTVRDGETVILGGLITETVEDAETKAPILGDIPYLGDLFKTTTKISNKTELLIVLTVDVVRDEYELREASEYERDLAEFLPDRVKRHRLMQGMRIKAGDDVFGPVEDGTNGTPVDQPTPKRDKGIYGPSLKTYGPATPTAAKESDKKAKQAAVKKQYGPRLVRDES